MKNYTIYITDYVSKHNRRNLRAWKCLTDIFAYIHKYKRNDIFIYKITNISKEMYMQREKEILKACKQQKQIKIENVVIFWNPLNVIVQWQQLSIGEVRIIEKYSRLDLTTKLSSSVKEWYKKKYPFDDIAEHMNDVTFGDVAERLARYENIYSCIGGVCDSIIREKIFIELANILRVNYNTIYKRWLDD